MSGIATVILVIHTLVAMAMIGVILLQRSEGGALGIGGGSGSFLSARSAGNVLTRTTTILVVIFFLTSMALTVLGRHTGPKSLQFGAPASGKVVTPQSVPAPAPAAPKPNQPANPISNLPGFGAGKPVSGGSAAPSNGAIQAPVSLEPAKPAEPLTENPPSPPAAPPKKP
jgi:preprotein translocase subunit SecG